MYEIKVIDEFLTEWKEKAKEYYKKAHIDWLEKRSESYEVNEDNLKNITKYHNGDYRAYSDDKVVEYLQRAEQEIWFKERLEGSIQYEMLKRFERQLGTSTMMVLERIGDLDKILDKEVEKKKKGIVSRVEKTVGEIVDATALRIGDNGEINGVIIGQNAKCKVETIYAGGYNIQCLHFRVLIKKIS